MVSRWTVRLTEDAEREFVSLGRRLQREVLELMESLEEDPFQWNAAEMRSANKTQRIYLADKRFRVIYQVNDHKRDVLIRRIRDRGTAYKGLKDS